MRIGLFWRVLPFYACIGMLFAVPFMQRQALALRSQNHARQAQAHLSTGSRLAQPPLVTGEPVRIVIPSQSIDLQVVRGTYVAAQGAWTVSGGQANYAANSVQLNNRLDKTLIYGHANSRVFSQTANLQPGDKAYVFAANGQVFEYVYTSKTVVKPTDVGIFDSLRGKPGLVLMSCDGTWYQNRRLMYFNLVRAS